MDSLQDSYLESTVGELVADDYRKAEFFKKSGIDFCCGGKKKLSDVCKSKGLDEKQFIESLEDFLQNKSNKQNSNQKNWELDFLTEYIINIHHSYVLENLPLLDEFTAKVDKVHGQGAPEVIEIRKLFISMNAELIQHMKKEEMVLFPYISRMAKYQRSTEGGSKPSIPFVNGPILVMEAEHGAAGEIIHRMEQITNNFTPPEDACNTWRVLYFKLKEFADDLFQHIHLENNILFPAAIKLEERLLKEGISN